MCWSNGPKVSWRKKKWSCRNEAGQLNGERLGWGGWGVARTGMCVPQVSAVLYAICTRELFSHSYSVAYPREEKR